MAQNEQANEEPKEAEKEAEEQTTDAPKSKAKLFILLGAGGLLVVGLTVTTLLLVLGGDDSPTTASKDQEQAEPKQETAEKESDDGESDATASVGSPQFFPIRPAIVVNIPSKGRIRFLQIQVDIMSRDDDVIEEVEAYAPLIKNELITLFSSQKYEDMVTVEGKEALRKEALKRVQKVMSDNAGIDGVEQILFTSFVTQ